jgi:hypothetical protein
MISDIEEFGYFCAFAVVIFVVAALGGAAAAWVL